MTVIYKVSDDVRTVDGCKSAFFDYKKNNVVICTNQTVLNINIIQLVIIVP
jgi:hypothetical protein